MKRKIFIGSSTEGKEIAEKVRTRLNSQSQDWLNAEMWNEGSVFSLNNSALHSLVAASRKYDYGILVASKDDFLKSRDTEHFVPRDNVMFEMGMFLGSLGLTRAFLLVEEHAKLPTDYNGVTVSYFQPNDSKSVEIAIDQITKSIENTKLTFNLKPAPSAALALGYFENFIQVLAKKRMIQGIDFRLEILIPKNINDVHLEKIKYKNSHPSHEISVFDDGQRPRVFERSESLHDYWDIPTTLSTLVKLLDLILPSTEIGINQEKKEWIDHELRNFAGAIMMLVNQCSACRDKVTVHKM
jgi:hypothetical protein